MSTGKQPWALIRRDLLSLMSHGMQAKGLRFEMAALARDGMVVDVQEGRRTRHAQQQQAPSQPPTPTVSEPPPVPQPPVPTPATSAQRKQGSSSSRRTGGAQLGEVQQQALPAQDEEQQPAADAQLERSSGRQKRGAALQAASAIARQAASRPSSADQAEAEDATSLGAGAHDGVAAEDASATSSAVPKQRTKSQGKPSGHAQKNGKLAGIGSCTWHTQRVACLHACSPFADVAESALTNCQNVLNEMVLQVMSLLYLPGATSR